MSRFHFFPLKETNLLRSGRLIFSWHISCDIFAREAEMPFNSCEDRRIEGPA